MKKSVSNVANEILSKSILKDDPVFSQDKPKIQLIVKKNHKVGRNNNTNDTLKNNLHLKLPIPTTSKEKELKLSATKGVVKFLNMIVQYKEGLKNKDERGIDLSLTRSFKSRALRTDIRSKNSRFDAVVRVSTKQLEDS